MLNQVFSEIRLICPECRHLPGASEGKIELKESFVEKAGHIMSGVLSCSNCNQEYPIVHGVPCVIKNVDDWMAWQETPEEQNMMKIFMDFHYGESERPEWAENSEYWESIVAFCSSGELALDLGCSVGRMTFELASRNILAIGLDFRLSALKIAVEKQIEDGIDNVIFIAGDALDPPFKAEYFGFVAALNLLDNVPYPLTLLGQIDALLRPNGKMLLASPYEWRNDITPKEEWLTPEQVKQAILGQEFTDCEFHYDILEELDCAWTMKNHERYYSHFISNILSASKSK